MQQNTALNLHVCEADRLSFLPYLFGDDYLLAEMQVYATADRYLPQYTGGFWHFIMLPAGGGYMAPDCDRVHVVNDDNWFDKTVSGEAAGIIVTLLAINHRCWLHHDRNKAGLVQLFMQREQQLYDYIETHPERADILRALD